jgi:hypothetical protein
MPSMTRLARDFLYILAPQGELLRGCRAQAHRTDALAQRLKINLGRRVILVCVEHYAVRRDFS